MTYMKLSSICITLLIGFLGGIQLLELVMDLLQ